ncbi:MAG: DUF4388 domain-containing protein [Desulfatitalea sp.]|nr:DUF4388 domain-containing protein [Desulfatitalea sp.]
MEQRFISEILTGDSDEIAELKANLTVLEGFIALARELDGLPEISKRFYEDSRSLYQATCTDRSIADLEALMTKYFGPPVKPAGKPLPRKLRKNTSVKYLGGVENDQSLFLLPLKTGEFYGALWPWRRNKAKIEIHMGYCSDWIADDHYHQLETLVKRCLSQGVMQQVSNGVGGQVHGISLPSFLQMAEMEQSSLTLRVSSAGRAGTLYVHQGQLIHAESDALAGCDAAYRIISWDNTTIEIAPADPSKKETIKLPLMHVLMESLKIKDEITGPSEQPPAPPLPMERRERPSGAPPGKPLVRLERAPEPRIRKAGVRLMTLFAIAVGIFTVLATATVIGFYIMENHSVSDKYYKVLGQVEEAQSPEQKIELLQKYLQDYPGTTHAAEIKIQLAQFEKSKEDRDFEQTILKISSLPIDDQYEQKAVSLYGDFLEKYPNSNYQKRIVGSMGDIKNLVNQYYYEELKRAARMDFSQRLQVYKSYLKRFPSGRYQTDVDTLIDEMGQQHLKYLKTEDAKCEQTQRWEPCVQRYESFIAEFQGMPLAESGHRMLAELQDKRDLAQLHKLKNEAGNDYEKITQAYREYLDTHPQSTQKPTLETELVDLNKNLALQRQWQTVQTYATNPGNSLYERTQRLDRYLRDNISGPYTGEAQELMNQLEAQRQLALKQKKDQARQQEEQARLQREREKKAQQQQRAARARSELTRQLSASSRYKVNTDGTFTDSTTGLTWNLLDSHQELGGCLDYDAARQYIQSIATGGFDDWRLPKASELGTIYKQKPFFPASGAEWYWSAEAYTRGYHDVVDVVTAKPETVFQRQQRRQNECGHVRAVRP